MNLPQRLISAYKRTTWVIDRQVDGLSHADSLLQPPFRANCMNWVLGHILDGRNRALAKLGLPTVLDESVMAQYASESEPLDGETAVPLPDLLAALTETQARIIAALEPMSETDTAVVTNPERGTTLGDYLEFNHWHETYHVGQLELLRQLAGTDDKVI
ncbi:MAG: DinB family protein [Anaerolineae bacterium]